MGKYAVALRFAFFFSFCVLSRLHVENYLEWDAISLGLLFIGTIPLLFPYIDRKLLPYLNTRFKSVELFGLKAELIEQKSKLEKQEQIIQELVVYSMAFYLYKMLCDFKRCEEGKIEEYIYRKSQNFEHNLRYLRDNGFIEMTFQIASLMDGENIAKKVKLTPIGRFYVDLREKFEIG